MKITTRIIARLGALTAFSLGSLLFAQETPPPEASEAPAAASVEQEQQQPQSQQERQPAKTKSRSRNSGASRGAEIVTFFSDAVVPEGKTARTVVAMGGDVHIDGNVREAVAIVGSVRANTDVDEIVSIVGSSTVNGGAREAVAVVGNVYVNSHVRGQVVAVGGGVELGPDARVDGQVIALGGGLKRDEAAGIGGQIVEIKLFNDINGFNAWVTKALAKGRLLAFDSALVWTWVVAGLFLLFYVVVSLLFPKAVAKCAGTLELHPGYVLLSALLALVLKPILSLVLTVTVVGPFVFGLLCLGAAIVGKAALFAWLGRRVTLPMGVTHPAPAVLLGGAVITLGYAIPYIGILVWMFGRFLATGIVVYALLLVLRRRRAERDALEAEKAATHAAAAGNPPAQAENPPAPLALAQARRAGFWIRAAALLIDFVLIAIVAKMCHIGVILLPLFAVYCIVMWALQGTTVGGIICGLKVARLDGRGVDWATAIVRALGGFISMAFAGLGFIWVAFDAERQSWHDKIAGTVVVHAPKGQSLV